MAVMVRGIVVLLGLLQLGGGLALVVSGGSDASAGLCLSSH